MSDLPDVKWAEYPQRKCRIAFTENGLTDHACELPEMHPGPDAAPGSKPSVERRQAWEAAHPGWEKLVRQDDPFEDVAQQLKEQN